MPKNFVLRTSLELLAISFELYCAVPFAIGAYPQHGSLTRDEIEAEFREMRDSKGELIKEFLFNKGL